MPDDPITEYGLPSRIRAAWRALVEPPEDEPHFTDYLIRAKLIAQESSSKPLGWGRAHALLQAGIRAGMHEERARIQKAIDEGGLRDD